MANALAATRLEDIFLHLKSKSVKVYFPAQHVGECLERYVVVKPAGNLPYFDYSTDYTVYELLVYVPQQQFSSIEAFINQIRGYMRELKSKIMIRESYYQSSPYYDSDLKGYMVSIEYKVYKRMTD